MIAPLAAGAGDINMAAHPEETLIHSIMRASAASLCAAVLVVAAQAAVSLAWDGLEEGHGIWKREVDCNDIRQSGGPHMMGKCCKNLEDIVDVGPPGPPHGPRRHGPGDRRRGPPGGRRPGQTDEQAQQGSSELDGQSEEGPWQGGGPPPMGGPGHRGPPPPGGGRGHRGPPPPGGGRGHRGPPPPPPFGPHGIDGLRCKVQAGFENKSLVSEGKVNSAAVQNYLQETLLASSTGWSKELIAQMVDNCTSQADTMLAQNNATNCTSGALEFQMCLRTQMFLNCPEDYWKSGDRCQAAKDYMRQCPMPPPPPPPPMGADGQPPPPPPQEEPDVAAGSSEP